MNKIAVMPMSACILALTAGCSSMPTSQTTQDLQTAPQFTEEEKEAMTTDEKAAVYNESMSRERDEIVCRRQHVVGSHFKKTVCRTRAEIEAEREAAQMALREAKGPTRKPVD
jgi:predicted kinase